MKTPDSHSQPPNTPTDEIVGEVYDELRRIAQKAMNEERAGHTLQATALVNEVYLRLDASGRHFAPVSLGFAINQQECALQLDQAGMLQVVEDTPAEPVDLPAEFFWRLLFGESGWTQLEPALQARGILVKPEIGALLRVLFPLQEVIFWAPDHY